MGYSHISAYDHILGVDPNQTGQQVILDPITEPSSDPFILFSYMASVTERVSFVTRILVLPQRQTALVAKQAATLDVLCNGRLRLGVGLGWNDLEFTARNEAFYNRSRRIEEQVSVLRQLWGQFFVNFSGNWHHIHNVGINPHPIQQLIQIWFGGHKEATLPRAAKLGDGWMPNDLTIDETRPLIRSLKQYLTEQNRDPTKFGIDPRVVYDSNIDRMVDLIREWASLGATHVSIDTMGLGFSKPEMHLKALRSVADIIIPIFQSPESF